MDKESVDKIIRSFYGKRFSESLHRLFGQWLTNSNDLEKEEVMKELWEESLAVETEQTRKEWQALRKQIRPAKSVSITRSLMKYAAVVLLIIATGIATHMITREYLKSQTAELVEFFVPYGESHDVELPDGTHVLVNAGSLLIYPENFTGDDRSVFLSGEATFVVTPDTENPFLVKTNHLTVEVLGTVFTVKAYPNEYVTTTTLEEGSVGVDIKTGTYDKLLLKPTEQLIYSHVDHTVSIQTVDMDLYRMERRGFLIFENASFRQLITTLERKYNVVIHYDSGQYENHKYNVKFAPGETIEEVMTVLHQLIGLRYKIEKNIIFIN